MQTRLSLPEWVYGGAIILLLIGLPIVLATAFVQEGHANASPHEGQSIRCAHPGPVIVGGTAYH